MHSLALADLGQSFRAILLSDHYIDKVHGGSIITEPPSWIL